METSDNNPLPAETQYHQEEAVVGVSLNNYRTRTPSEDGQYVKIVTHTERIEKIKQPPTPEEIAQKRKEDRVAAAVVGSCFAGLIGFLGWLAYVDSKRPQDTTDFPQGEEVTA